MTRQKLSDINVKLSESIEGMRIVQAFRQEKRLTGMNSNRLMGSIWTTPIDLSMSIPSF